MDRRRLWQLKKQALGLCTQCGKNKTNGKLRCKKCSEKRKNYRKRQRDLTQGLTGV